MMRAGFYDRIRYITPSTTALAEAREGINTEHLYQDILSGVLIGLGKTPQEAIEQVEEWERTVHLSCLQKVK